MANGGLKTWGWEMQTRQLCLKLVKARNKRPCVHENGSEWYLYLFQKGHDRLDPDPFLFGNGIVSFWVYARKADPIGSVPDPLSCKRNEMVPIIVPERYGSFGIFLVFYLMFEYSYNV